MDQKGRRLTKSRMLGLSVSSLVLLLFGGSIASFSYTERKDEPTEIYWPAPPAKARIKYVRSISSPRDLNLKQSSFLKRFVKKIVGIDDGDASLLFPYGITTDSHNRMIVVDSKQRLIHVFDPQEKKYLSLKQPKGEVFVSIVGVALDADDNVYVSDSFAGKIFVFERSGKFKERLGPDEGQFNRPTGLAIDKSRKRLYVVETVKGEVDVLNLKGQEIFKFGKRGVGKGEFNRPTHICIRGDRVYVTDTLNARIQIFDLDGTYISSVGHLGDAIGDLDKPKGVAVDSDGHIYVVGGLLDVVEIFDHDGRFLLAFGGTGSKLGQFYLPTAIHIDAEDNIYVSDTYNRRVQVFKYLKNASESGE